jgi:hypothetical protein
MESYLLKNGEVFCGLHEPHPPRSHDGSWHDCVVTAEKRVVAEAGDVFGIQRPSGSVPFVITHCCIAADGWEVEGKVQSDAPE